MESILDSLKKPLGMDPNYRVFDEDLIMHINSIFAVLHQLGVGPKDGYSIQSNAEEWSSFLQNNVLLNDVKTYMYLKLRLLFDPPASSSVLKSYEEQCKELEWRMNITAEEGGE